jgi:hypothetical protein
MRTPRDFIVLVEVDPALAGRGQTALSAAVDAQIAAQLAIYNKRGMRWRAERGATIITGPTLSGTVRHVTRCRLIPLA